ncbi:MAG: hypothetical protein JWS10_138 [Cypionkella sp.]|nr:hypothetical protein [Cypionkella sp.]
MPQSPAAILLFIVKLLLRTEWNLAETERPPDAASPSNRPMTSPRARALLRTNQANTPSASLSVLARDSRFSAIVVQKSSRFALLEPCAMTHRRFLLGSMFLARLPPAR